MITVRGRFVLARRRRSMSRVLVNVAWRGRILWVVVVFWGASSLLFVGVFGLIIVLALPVSPIVVGHSRVMVYLVVPRSLFGLGRGNSFLAFL